MYINKKDDNISKLSFKKEYLQTKPKERIISSPFDIIVKEKQYLTSKELDNRQKLLDFISDKKKLSLKSVFDHKGTKSFLSDKELAMKRIELNENIEKINVDEIENKSIKKVRHKKSADFLLDNNNDKNDLILNSNSSKKNIQNNEIYVSFDKNKNKKNEFSKKTEDLSPIPISSSESQKNKLNLNSNFSKDNLIPSFPLNNAMSPILNIINNKENNLNDFNFSLSSFNIVEPCSIIYAAEEDLYNFLESFCSSIISLLFLIASSINFFLFSSK